MGKPSYEAWKERAVRLLKEKHGHEPHAVSERGWKWMFITGKTVADAAQAAAIVAHNALPRHKARRL